MCTVVYIPKDNSVFFASLRDESPLREQAIEPRINNTDAVQYLAPKDALAGGSWVGVNEFNNVIILLNGGFENHKKQNNYRKSRGLIVTELLQSELPVIEWNLMDMTNIEPFTLVVWSDHNLFQLVWDGQEKHKTLMDTTIPHIWSSSTLYNPSIKRHRKQLFNDWVKTNQPISSHSVLHFFKSFVDKDNGFIMNRSEILSTLSYSFIEIQNSEKAIFNYLDFQSNQNTAIALNIHNTFTVLTNSIKGSQ